MLQGAGGQNVVAWTVLEEVKPSILRENPSVVVIAVQAVLVHGSSLCAQKFVCT